MDPVRIM